MKNNDKAKYTEDDYINLVHLNAISYDKIRDQIISIAHHFKSDCKILLDDLYLQGINFIYNDIAVLNTPASTNTPLRNPEFRLVTQLHLDKYSSPFLYMLSKYALKTQFVILFDSRQNLKFCSINFDIKDKAIKHSFLFDKNLNFIRYSSYLTHSPVFQDEYHIRHTQLSSVEDHALWTILTLFSNNEDIVNTLPEFYISGVYNFSSDDFRKRLSLVLMMIY